jgi:tetratricopeptide (TPR) repeat protein
VVQLNGRVAENSVVAGVNMAAALIVRNEHEHLDACLASLSGAVDEVVVYDTGSTDDTVRIARQAGARVQEGTWDGDFAAARDRALAMTDARWVLSLDADERLTADPSALRALLERSESMDVLAVRIRNDAPADLGGSYVSTAPRLLHRNRVRWVGRVHERPARGDGGPMRVGTCPTEAIFLDHLGYTDPERLVVKSRRNTDLGRAELKDLLAVTPRDDDRIAQVLLDLGRSLIGGGRRQEAVEALEMLRELAPGSVPATQGTDALAGLLLADGQDEVVLVLVEELRKAGVDNRYCNWVQGQALAQLGQPGPALQLLRTVDSVVDATGRDLGVGRVLEVRALVAQLVGEHDEARRCLLSAMAEHGRIVGRGDVLARLHADRPVGEFVDAVRDCPSATRQQLISELAGVGDPGPALASALAGTTNG